ncbi:DUF2842 domain-containing protein [Sphingomonas sinipercae]|uniref:DUF2842 domain-containing protein n=1 Tax=Sphingomonas sinipercae TaxID=2714944 RepID=A0A6G7ZMN2_9SPHN|nr:DUF2842 domain-containing protein [Sphingomonas sinipercae]QIL02185.1 DUF2842 domain-containing protein [Sphingomonas sinipercae]
MVPVTPSWRKPAAIVAIVGLIVVTGLIAVALSRFVGSWPVLLQSVFYLALGLVWILPLKPLLRWAETGQWRAHSGGGH